MLIVLLIAFTIGTAWLFSKSRQSERRAYRSFIVESAPNDKEREIEIFWRRVEAAETEQIKKEVKLSQREYCAWRKKGQVLEFLAYTFGACALITLLTILA